MPRVAVNAVALAPGGGLTYLANQAAELERRQDWSFTYFVTARSADRLGEIIPNDKLINPFGRQPGYLRRLLWEQWILPNILRGGSFDILYCPANFGIIRSPLPQIVVDHNSYHHASHRELGWTKGLMRARLERWYARYTFRAAEQVVYLSRAYAGAMRAAGFPDANGILPSGASTDWPDADENDLFPLDCHACEAGGFALAVHNWYRHKRLEWLVRCWAEDEVLRTQHLVLVGDALDRRGRSELRGARKLAERATGIHLLNRQPRASVAALFSKASTYVSASVLEAFPLTPVEAMSFGVPCILSDIDAHREIAGDAAVYFRTGDCHSLRVAVRDADVNRSSLLLEAKALPVVSWAQNVDLLLERFQELLST